MSTFFLFTWTLKIPRSNRSLNNSHPRLQDGIPGGAHIILRLRVTWRFQTGKNSEANCDMNHFFCIFLSHFVTICIFLYEPHFCSYHNCHNGGGNFRLMNLMRNQFWCHSWKDDFQTRQSRSQSESWPKITPFCVLELTTKTPPVLPKPPKKWHAFSFLRQPPNFFIKRKQANCRWCMTSPRMFTRMSPRWSFQSLKKQPPNFGFNKFQCLVPKSNCPILLGSTHPNFTQKNQKPTRCRPLKIFLCTCRYSSVSTVGINQLARLLARNKPGERNNWLRWDTWNLNKLPCKKLLRTWGFLLVFVKDFLIT